MQTTTLLTLIIAGLVLALIGLAIYSRRTAESARADGYDEGYDDAKHGHDDRIAALHEDIERLHRKHTNLIAEHRLERDAIMQDCDARIAIYARRASPFGIADRLALADIHAMLKLAANTFAGLQANDSAVRARDLMNLVQDMDRRLVATLPTAETTEQEKAA
ncbi:hypothetical protein [Pseudomonas anguilliseptica]|uniref:Uncharacterized protein n=1 Tax=Pseudomonas anguilliseptica TaxID=53406 RepID=A0A1H4UU44_PSEAG|nr:hypothetical protein [Pseudomonas anguilliseptica]SEC72299.1 hypothetical protein SAMN05421553_1335 [Pseudomonas anguilliseptica]